MSKMSNEIRKYIEIRNISITKLAESVGLSPHQLRAILNGRSSTHLDTISKIAQKLEIPSDLLLQDYGKIFTVFAIDHYLNIIDKDTANKVFNELINLYDNEE